MDERNLNLTASLLSHYILMFYFDHACNLIFINNFVPLLHFGILPTKAFGQFFKVALSHFTYFYEEITSTHEVVPFHSFFSMHRLLMNHPLFSNAI